MRDKILAKRNELTLDQWISFVSEEKRKTWHFQQRQIEKAERKLRWRISRLEFLENRVRELGGKQEPHIGDLKNMDSWKPLETIFTCKGIPYIFVGNVRTANGYVKAGKNNEDECLFFNTDNIDYPAKI